MNISKILYSNKSNDNYIKKTYFLGLLSYKKDKKSYGMVFRFCGLPILKKKISKGNEKYYFLFLKIFQKSSRKYLYNIILRNINNNYNNIYVNYNCSGETYLYLAFIRPSQDSVFIATKKYHIDLCKMMHPEIDCIYMPEILPLRSIDNIYEEKYHNKTFYNVLPFKHFIRLENKICNDENIHYCEEICKTIGIETNSAALTPQISDNAKVTALEKAKRIGLNLENFVFLCPESQSNEDPADDFWKNIIEDFYNKGCDVFLNILNLQPKYGIAKTCFLTFEEAYYIASLSKEIIGLRSGFIEYLTAIQNVPITCYYTDFKIRGKLEPISAKNVLTGFTLKKLPNSNINLIKEEIVK